MYSHEYYYLRIFICVFTLNVRICIASYVLRGDHYVFRSTMGSQLRAPLKTLGTILQLFSWVLRAYQIYTCLKRGIASEIKSYKSAMKKAR